jgi:dolichol-phosphate mannosyltransferase
MSAPVVKLSVVCPIYEEEEVLPCFHAELTAELAKLPAGYDVEIIYIDDGSRDRTLPILRMLAATDARVRYLSLSRNFGQQAALTAGLEHARGDVVVSMDSDLQHPPAVIPRLLERWKEGYDVVLTLREDDPRLGRMKRWTAAAFYKVMRLLSDTEMRAAASDFRLLSRKALDALLRLNETHRFLRGMVGWLGFPTATVTFALGGRGAGSSKYTFRKMMALAVDAMLSFSKVPLRLTLFGGAALLGVGLLLLLGACGRGLFVGGVDWGWTALMVTMLLVGGSMLCGLGVVGEYVGRIYEQVKGRPLYLLKEASPERMAAALPFDEGDEASAA